MDAVHLAAVLARGTGPGTDASPADAAGAENAARPSGADTGPRAEPEADGGKADPDPFAWAPTGLSGLGERRALLAALRPFHLRRPTGPDRRLDAEASARGYAAALFWDRDREEGPGVPAVGEPAERRATDLTLLVDNGASMAFHQGVVRGFARLVRHSGAFRRVRELTFDSGAAGEPTERDTGEHGRPGVRASTGGPHVVLVLTDGLGDCWRDPAFRRWMAELGGRAATAIVHLLHPRLWRRSGLSPAPARLRARWNARPGDPNTRYLVRGAQGAPLPEGGVFPVFSLKPEALRDWAAFVMGRSAGALWTPVTVFPGPGDPDSGAFDRAVTADSRVDAGADRVEDAAALVGGFQRTASPEAFELAVALAAVPLEPDMVDAVCEDLFGGPAPSELAEVFFGGLLSTERSWAEPDPGTGAAAPADAATVSMEFRRGVRRHLLARGGRVSEIRRMLLLATTHFAGDPVFEDLSRVLRTGGEAPTGEAVESAPRARAVLPALESISLGGRVTSVLPRGLVLEEEIRGGSGVFESGGVPFPGTLSEQVRASSGVGIRGRGEESHNRGKRTFSDIDERNSMAGHSQDTGPIPPGGAESRGRPVNAVWIQVPKRNPSFVGRDDLLAQLRNKIQEGKRQVLTTLNGTSGVGKTELAKEYLYRYAGEYDLICWIPATYENQIRGAFSMLADRLGLDVGGAGSSHVVHGVLEALRQGRTFGRWLLVFDNAESREALNTYLPVAGEGHVIITSRDQSWSRDGADTFLPVTVFSRDESIELLKRRGPKSLTAEEADQIAEELGDLPLALNQAAVWLNEVGMDIEDYLARLSEKHPEMIQMLGPVDPEYPIPVAAAWNVSLDRLAVTNRAALQLLQLCSFMDPAPIPRDLFKFARDIEGPKELRRALADPARLGMAIRDIGRYSLAQVDHQQNTLSLHRLVSVAVQAPMTDEEKDELRHCAHQLLARNDPQGSSAEDQRRYAALIPHVWASQAWDCRDPWVRELVVQLCRVANGKDDFDEAMRFGQAAHAHWSEHLGPEHRVTLQMAIEISYALRGQGQLDRARELCETTMHKIGEIFGEESPEYTKAETAHARNLRIAGRFQESLAVSAASYETRVRLFGEDDPATLSAAHFFGFDLLLVGRLNEAVDRYADVWARKEMVLGPDHGVTWSSADGYSDALMESGRYREAHELQQRLVDQVVAQLGPDDAWALDLSDTLASMKRRVGLSEQAQDLSARVLRRLRSRQGEEDSGTLHAALTHSMALYSVRRFDEALELAQESGERYVKLFGEDHTHAMAAQVNRAIILRRLDRGVEARQLDEQAMEVFLDRFGPLHHQTLSCAVNLATDRFRAGDVAGARDRDGRTFAECGEALGERHPLTLLARRNLLIDQWAMGDEDREALEAVQADYRDVMGVEHPATLSIGQLARGDADIYFGRL